MMHCTIPPLGGNNVSLIEPVAPFGEGKRPKVVVMIAKKYFGMVYADPDLAEIQKSADILGYFFSEEELAEADGILSQAEVIMGGWGVPKLDAALLNRMPALKAVFYAAGSVKTLASEAFWQSGRILSSAAMVNAIPVAEYNFAQILLCLKHGWQLSARYIKDRVMPDQFSVPGAYGSVVGLISLGACGRMVRQKLNGSDLKVIAYDPYVSAEEARELGVEMCGLEELFERADVISCNTPSLEATRNMICGRHFERMKPGATFINTSRGAVVNHDEMIEVLKGRGDIFAVLDVTDPEPLPANSILFELPNVLLTPHIAGSAGGECARMGHAMVEELKRYIANEPLRYRVDPRRLGIMA